MDQIKACSEAILRIMEHELQTVCGLIGFAQEKERLLIHADAESLPSLLEKEEDLVIELRERERERRATLKSLVIAAGLSEENLTLGRLAKLNEPEMSRRLVNAGKEIVEKMRELSRHNEKVKTLLKRQVGYTNFMLRLLFGTQEKALFYNGQGNMENKENNISRLNYQA